MRLDLYKNKVAQVMAGASLSLWMGLGFCATQGIYINQSTAENTSKLNYLIRESKATGIDTFVVDLKRAGPRYASNIERIKNAGLKYVARVVIFPGGGTPGQVKSRSYWEKKYNLVARAIQLGADEIQLDYIRYNTKQPGRAQNARDVLEVIKFFKARTDKHNVPLQIDVFGEASFKPSRHIGQDIQVFAPYIDVLNPMLYPSHFEPYKKHAVTPYKTVHNALEAIKRQFNQNPPFKIRAYIELYNYRYSMSTQARMKYIQAQIRATRDANIDGWYAWSAKNQYGILFDVLKQGSKVYATQ